MRDGNLLVPGGKQSPTNTTRKKTGPMMGLEMTSTILRRGKKMQSLGTSTMAFKNQNLLLRRLLLNQ
jgi:hypothetical protein